MSTKVTEAQEDRIPSYEESVASAPRPSSNRTGISQKTSPVPFQQRIKEKRQRRIASILLNHVEPAISANLEDATNDMTLILLAADSLPEANNLTASTITSPALTKPTTLLRITDGDVKSAFLGSWPVVQELSDTLIRSMVDPSTLPQLQAQLPDLNTAAETLLPDRPTPKSWLKRTFGMPSADHDPTGQTGRWNLGWKSEENAQLTTRTITTNQISITAKLVDVVFRTESALGLLESTTVKCLWLNVLYRA